MTPLAPYLSTFLRAHLPREYGASQHTIASYAHCYRLLPPMRIVTGCS